MDQQHFEQIIRKTLDEVQQLLIVKGGEYAGSEDRLANFKRGAQLTGCTPLQCLFVYMSKHYDAFATFVRDDATGRERVRSEPINGRLDDLINYCLLAKAMLAEKYDSKEPARGISPAEMRQMKGALWNEQNLPYPPKRGDGL